MPQKCTNINCIHTRSINRFSYLFSLWRDFYYVYGISDRTENINRATIVMWWVSSIYVGKGRKRAARVIKQTFDFAGVVQERTASVWRDDKRPGFCRYGIFPAAKTLVGPGERESAVWRVRAGELSKKFCHLLSEHRTYGQ